MPEFLNTDATAQEAAQRAHQRAVARELDIMREERRQQHERQQADLQQAGAVREAVRKAATAKLATRKAGRERRAELVAALVPILDELWRIEIAYRETVASIEGAFDGYDDFSQARQQVGLPPNHTDTSPAVHNAPMGDYGRWLAGTIEIMLAGSSAAQLAPGYARLGQQEVTFTP